MHFVLMTHDFHRPPGFFSEHDEIRSEQPYLDHATRFDTSEQAAAKLASISGSRNAPPFIVTPLAEAEACPGVMKTSAIITQYARCSHGRRR